MTPEGKVKASIRKLLNVYGAYYFQPVQMGIGSAGLDFHCMLTGAKAFFIEAKAKGKHPTPRQRILINTLQHMRAKVFIIYDEVTLAELEDWLNEHSRATTE